MTLFRCESRVLRPRCDHQPPTTTSAPAPSPADPQKESNATEILAILRTPLSLHRLCLSSAQVNSKRIRAAEKQHNPFHPVPTAYSTISTIPAGRRPCTCTYRCGTFYVLSLVRPSSYSYRVPRYRKRPSLSEPEPSRLTHTHSCLTRHPHSLLYSYLFIFSGIQPAPRTSASPPTRPPIRHRPYDNHTLRRRPPRAAGAPRCVVGGRIAMQ